MIYSGDLASRVDEKTLAMSVDVGTVALALASSSDTSYEPRISFFMKGMKLVVSNPRGEARLGRMQQPDSYVTRRRVMDDCYGSREYQRTHSLA